MALKGFNSLIYKNPVLKNTEFIDYLFVRFAIIFSLNMQSTIIYFWIFDITSSKLALGFIGLAEVIPAVFCSLFSGYFVDHAEKKGMILKCSLGYIFLAILLFLLTSGKILGIQSFHIVLILIYIAIFLGGIIRAFLSPSFFALLGLIIPKNEYANASSWGSMAWQIGAVAGPLVAGTMIAWKGVQAGMFVVVLIQVLSLIPLLRIKKKPIIKSEQKEAIFESLSIGLKFVFKTPVLLAAQCLDLFSVLFGGAVALLPVYQKEILHVSDIGFGVLRAAPGIGALLSLAIIAFSPLKKNPGRKLFLCMFGFGASIIIFGISRNFYLSFFMLVLTGVFDAVNVVIRDIIMQLVTPDYMRGRVAAVKTMFVSSSNELGDFESGIMAHWLGTVRAVVVGGSITLAVVAFTFMKSSALRNFKISDKNNDEKL